MKIEVMVALQALAGVVMFGLMIARIVVAQKRYWLPYYSERIGVTTYALGCAMAVALSIYWIINGVRQIRWRDQGFSDLHIRLKLITPGEFKGIFATTTVCAVSMWLGKVSFLCVYAPSYKRFSKPMQRLFKVAVVFTIASFIAVLGLYVFWCYPTSRNWRVTDPDFCVAVLMAPPLHSAMILSCVSDLILFAVPVLVVLNLASSRTTVLSGSRTARAISTGERFGVLLLLILGFVSIIVSIYRVVDANVNGYLSNKPLPLGKRNTYIAGEMLSMVTLMVAFALPSLRALVRSRRKARRQQPWNEGLEYETRENEREGSRGDGGIETPEIGDEDGDKKRLWVVEMENRSNASVTRR
ncbi:hypothetical protein EX30DRAFT_395106 [Ascodesmis nigricans]|uniref:Rhodopsin domain-containing protein n=1 Tax=Ascodesmis nigricans TaxID=341454 RepID=A0A4S2MZK7_9PEZI|nr:hypothetical protein EX30DRAFT_395106 [Ascodesmis nigricans]